MARVPDKVGVSQKKFAEIWGKSRAAVQRGIAANRIPVEPDGSIIPAKAMKALAENTDPGQASNTRGTGRSDPNFLQARTATEVLKAQERRLRLQKLQGELISLPAAEQILFECAREYRDAWLSWPARVAVEMAAELNVDARTLADVLNRYVKAHLDEQGEPDADFAAAAGRRPN